MVLICAYFTKSYYRYIVTFKLTNVNFRKEVLYMMNKISRIIICMLALFLITGCSSEKAQTQNDNDILKVGMDLKFPPFSYMDNDGNAVGLEPTIAKAFAEYLGVEVEIVNVDFSMLIPALDTGDVDILIADMSKTEERAVKADFSNPYRYTYTLALVNKAFAEEHNITDDMPEEEFFAIPNAKFIGLSGTKGVFYPQKYGIDVKEVTEIGTGLVEISNGMSDVLVASNEVHGFHAADTKNTIVYSGIKNQDGSCFVVKKGNTALLEKANEFIATLYEKGGLYEQIKEEYDEIIGEFLQNKELGLDYIVNPVE